ncbi:Gfo/Idh/MocA family protein [Magnetospirillum gryphiswaldense]|uniref:LmbZ n=1 Tax=Magnetospirillum gryphiswaldense TaxID=55518 RepID=A4U164_9PROT|nr:Gfo/Idh/MocA family oxidoreductase [Magnetospirillum gryphiswaldense]AVM75598.1 putative oxidoreductase YcjS [Magnetospirillum gryphiswaldense MSR-1]AVM79501.1 putative oxidoreductase YcjS [Magnetospirillum gryphiswaldense]CAM76621.1 LmbZ [Magnetospirillum gryphiswaldense MSR-1]
MSPLRVAIAGFGVVGKRRRQFIDQRDDMRVVAVCDRTFADEGRMEDGVAYHQTPEQVLRTPGLDALFVCLTNDVAADVTIAGLERGLHVFCEKPPGRDVPDIERVIAAERRNPGLKLKYGFNHRYHDSVRDALALVQSGQFGQVLNMRGVYGKSQFISYGAHSDWRTQREVAGGGILLDQGIHMVDLMRLFGGEFNEVSSIVSNDFWKHEVEDNAYALMRSDQGCIAMLHSTATQWRHRFNLEITCQKGALILSGILSGSKSYGAETLTVVWAGDDDQGDPKEQTTRYNRDPSWADEIAEFADACLCGGPIQAGSSDDALRTMRLVYRIYCADPAWKQRWNLKSPSPESRS